MDLWERPAAYDPRPRPARAPTSSMVARARAIDRWRSGRALARAVDRSTQEAGAAQSHESAADGVLRRERSRQVLRALDEIPRVQREALLLTGTGLAHHEIAQRHAHAARHRQGPRPARPAEGPHRTRRRMTTTLPV